MNRRVLMQVLSLLHRAEAMIALELMESGPENSREEVAPSDRSPQRDCKAGRLAAAALAVCLAACAAKPAIAPEPRVVTVEVPRIVEVRCNDQRPPAPDFPDDDQKLSSIPDDDFFTLAKVYRAARDLYRARLAVDDVQIKGCAAEQ
jgi:hypothetical protein